jgi:hypothetical protein
MVRVGDSGAGELGDAEENAGGEETPQTGHADSLYEKVRADAWPRKNPD